MNKRRGFVRRRSCRLVVDFFGGIGFRRGFAVFAGGSRALRGGFLLRYGGIGGFVFRRFFLTARANGDYQ